VIWTFGRTYARLGGRTLLSVVRTYVGGPPDVRLVIARRTYAPKPGRTVTVWQGNPIFAKRPIAYVFFDLGLL
jgi:hypothetical protein